VVVDLIVAAVVGVEEGAGSSVVVEVVGELVD